MGLVFAVAVLNILLAVVKASASVTAICCVLAISTPKTQSVLLPAYSVAKDTCRRHDVPMALRAVEVTGSL